jgi:hypothetical protein
MFKKSIISICWGNCCYKVVSTPALPKGHRASSRALSRTDRCAFGAVYSGWGAPLTQPPIIEKLQKNRGQVICPRFFTPLMEQEQTLEGTG